MTKRLKDTIYAQPRQQVEDFVFDESVANVFEDMISRSVPCYNALLELLGLFVKNYAPPKSRLYDLGCSQGSSSLKMLEQLGHSDAKLIAVDNSPAMVEHCNARLSQHNFQTTYEVLCEDIRQTVITDASIVTLNLTLQFIPPKERLPLLQRIYAGMRSKGALILVEKIIFTDSPTQSFHTQMHETFKKSNGYSELEISQKRSALENVLIPDTLNTHENRLKACGFNEVYQYFSCLNFVGLLAIK